MSTKTLSKAEMSKSNLSDEGEMQKANSSKFSKTISLNPRIKELLKDKIFQYYFIVYYNSKEYTEFKSFPDQEKLSFMLNLYFFIMKDVSKDSLFDLKAVNTEEQMNNINGEIMDRLLMLKDDFAKKRIINTINVYNINNIVEQGSLQAKFQAILDKYRLDDHAIERLGLNQSHSFNANCANSNTFKQCNNNINDQPVNDMSNSFNKNSLMKEKQKYMQETASIPIHSMPFLLNNNNNNEKNNSSFNYVNYNYKNNNDNSNIINRLIPSSISLKVLSKTKVNSFVKINYNQVSIENMGFIEKGNYYISPESNKEIEYTSEKTVYISNSNGIQQDNSSHYILCNNKKLKHPNNKTEFTTQLNYKTLINPNQVSNVSQCKQRPITRVGGAGIKCKSQSQCPTQSQQSFYSNVTHNNNSTRGKGRTGCIGRNQNEKVVHNIVLLNQSISDAKFNLVLQKSDHPLPEDMNEIIHKLFSDDNNLITLSYNEANKIGILLIEFIRLEKKFNDLMNSKSQLQSKYDKSISGLKQYRFAFENKLNEAKLFLQETVVQ